jgi:hypothetical protein
MYGALLPLNTLSYNYLSYILYGDCFNSEGSHTKYMGLGSLIHFVWGFLSHTFCMGISLTHILYGDFSHTFCMVISLIHFVWGLLQLLELGRAAFNSVDLADA